MTKFKGNASGTLAENVSVLRTDVPRTAGAAGGTVFEPDGATPATNSTVRLIGGSSLTTDTDRTGRVAFVDLPLALILCVPTRAAWA